MKAAEKGHSDVLKLLLSAGANKEAAEEVKCFCFLANPLIAFSLSIFIALLN